MGDDELRVAGPLQLVHARATIFRASISSPESVSSRIASFVPARPSGNLVPLFLAAEKPSLTALEKRVVEIEELDPFPHKDEEVAASSSGCPRCFWSSL